MLIADPQLSSKVLTEFFRKIWEGEVIPEDWSKGIVEKLPKNGDKGKCDNWRGITLLSIPSKIREEQTITGRGCIDQFFSLCNIIEQCSEWNQPLHINFVDFRKAF